MKAPEERKDRLAIQLGSQALVVFLGNCFSLLVGLPLQIYVARVLGTEGLGTFGLIEGGVATLAGFLALGIAPTVVRFIPEHLGKREYGCVRKLLWTGAALLAGVGLSAYVLVLVSLPWIGNLWPEVADYGTAIAVMAVLVPIGLLSIFLQQSLRGFQEIRYMVLGSSVLQLAAKAVLTVVLFFAGLKLMGYILAVVAASGLTVLWMLRGLKRKVGSVPCEAATLCKGKTSTWRRYATVMYSKSLLDVGLSHLDRFLLGFFAGAGPVGVLVVVRHLVQFPMVFHRMLLTVAAPMFASAHVENEHVRRQRIHNLMTDWVVRGALPLMLFLVLFSGPILSLYGNQFAEQGTYALRALLAAQAVNILTGPVVVMLNMSGFENKVLKLAIFQAALTASGLFILVPAFGLNGGATSIGIGIAFMNFGALLVARRCLDLQWWDRRYLRWIAPGASALVAGLWLSSYLTPSGAVELLGCLATSYVVFFGVSLVQGFHGDDLELFKHLQHKLRMIRFR